MDEASRLPRSTRGAWRAPTGSARRAPERPRQAQLPGLDDVAEAGGDELDVLADSAPARRTANPRPRNIPRATAGAAVREFPAARRRFLPRSRAGWIAFALATVSMLSVVVAAGVLFRRYLLRDVHFRIDHSGQIASLGGPGNVQSSNSAQVTRSEMLSVFGQDIGHSIFFVPLAQRRRELESIPWVRQATVMRILPDRILIHIVERTPVAFARDGDNVELVDADGVLLPISPSRMAMHHYSFPVITGLHAHPAMASPQERMALYQRFIADLDHAQPHASSQISEIDLSDPDDLRATLSDGSSDLLVHFGADNFAARYQMYLAHIAEWHARYPHLIGIDLRFPGDVPLELAPEDTKAPLQTTAAHAATASAPPPVLVSEPPASTLHRPEKSMQNSSSQHAPAMHTTSTAHRASSLHRASHPKAQHHPRASAAKPHRVHAKIVQTSSRHPQSKSLQSAPAQAGGAQ